MDSAAAGASLKLAGVSLTRGRRRVLDRIDLTVDAGELRVLFGGNGAGKTSLLRLIAGLETPDRGEIRISDRTVSHAGAVLVPPHARGIAVAFQEDALWPHLSVKRHLRFGLDRRVSDPAERERRVGDALAFFALEAERRRYPGELSGGEQQRLNLARALVQPAALFLLDEPAAHLDLASQRPLTRALADTLRERGATVLWVTHSLEEIDLLGARVSILSNGRIAAEVEAEEIEDWLDAQEGLPR